MLELQFPTCWNCKILHHCTIVLNIIDSVENKQKNAAAANDFKEGQNGMAIFMHSIAVIS